MGSCRSTVRTLCYLPCVCGQQQCCGTMCSKNKSTPFLPGSDDSDEGNQGRTMATEYELAPLEGAAMLPVCCSRAPRAFLSFPLMLCLPRRRRDLEIISGQHVSWCHFETLIPDAFESMFQVPMGRPAPNSAETGKLVRRRRTKLHCFEVQLWHASRRLRPVVVAIRHVRSPSAHECR